MNEFGQALPRLGDRENGVRDGVGLARASASRAPDKAPTNGLLGNSSGE